MPYSVNARNLTCIGERSLMIVNDHDRLAAAIDAEPALAEFRKDPSELTPDIRAALGACVARAASGGG